jgi:hypothetical protein
MGYVMIHEGDLIGALDDVQACQDCAGGRGLHVDLTTGDYDGVVVHNIPCPNAPVPALVQADALRERVASWERERLAAIQAGDGSAEATDAANAALLAHLEELRRVLLAHGANTKAVDEYVAAVKQAGGTA